MHSLPWRWLFVACVLAAFGLAGCGAPSQAQRPGALTNLYVVKSGPYPLYTRDGEWLASRLTGLPLAEIDQHIISEAQVAQAQNRASRSDAGPWLHSGCIFDVQRMAPDAQDGDYFWAYGKVVRCDEPVVTGLPEPQMGVRPREVRIYDGLLGYFPARLLDRYTGSPPAPRASSP
ncbi:MAG TPA: hypothetical protein VGL99_16135 [Chloroflexota bacterium]